MREISNQREFYSLLGSKDLINYLIDKKLIQKKPNRCRKCRKFNTFKMICRKPKNQQLVESDMNYSYICSKFN